MLYNSKSSILSLLGGHYNFIKDKFLNCKKRILYLIHYLNITFKYYCFCSLLIETYLRNILLVISLNLLFINIYNKKLNYIHFLLIYIFILFIYMFWKKNISKKVREHISYSGFEDIDGWIVIDNVELANEPDDRVWKVISTCGNMAKFLLILRRHSYTKYTFVVVPSCLASAILGRYIPGIVLFHLASMSFISWPFVSFFPCLLFNSSRYFARHLSHFLSNTLPRSYYKIKHKNNNGSKDASSSKNSLLIISSYMCSFLPSLSLFRLSKQNTDKPNKIKDSPKDNFIVVRQIEDKTIKTYSNGLNDENVTNQVTPSTKRNFLWTALLPIDCQKEIDAEFLPELDEKAAFILEEACETSSTNSSCNLSITDDKTDSFIIYNDDLLPDYDDNMRWSYNTKERRTFNEPLTTSMGSRKLNPDDILLTRNMDEDELNVLTSKNVKKMNFPSGSLNERRYNNNFDRSDNDKDSISSSTSSYVRELQEKADEAGDAFFQESDKPSINLRKSKNADHDDEIGKLTSSINSHIISESLKNFCVNFNESVNAWAKSVTNASSHASNKDSTSNSKNSPLQQISLVDDNTTQINKKLNIT